MRYFMAFDIGGSSVKASVINEKGEILNNSKIKIADNVDSFFDLLVESVEENRKQYTLDGIAISAPGAVDSDTGIIGGISAIPYIHGPNFKEILKDRTRLNVEIENDANCAALGECWLGAAKEANDSAFVVCGSGIGGAIVKNKKIHRGVHKFGGEFGYCVIKEENGVFKTWSQIGSTTALARNIANRKGVAEESIDGLKAFELCNNGDKVAQEEVDKYFTYMALGIYNIQYTYDPEVIVLGGAICEREEYISSINEKIDFIMHNGSEGVIKPILKKCDFGNDANKIGAVYHYMTRIK